jgi:hypothetical protein
MDPAWIALAGGLSGVLIGSGLTEYFRRASRIETYSAAIFERRLSIYESLFKKLAEYQSVAEDVMTNDKYSDEERHSMISQVVLDIASYCDEHAFHLNEELTVHCVSAYMGAEDVLKLKGSKRQKDAVQNVHDNVVAAKKMIRREAGIERIDKFFGTVTKAKLSSPIIERYRELSKDMGR